MSTHKAMCIAIQHAGQIIRWEDEAARLPVLRKDGRIEWVTWGLPFGQMSHKAPAGGCASLDAIRSGKWKKYGVRPAKIAADRFAVLDGAVAERWIDLAPGLAIQGALIATDNKIQTAATGAQILRVYIVTEPPSIMGAGHPDKMPRIIKL